MDAAYLRSDTGTAINSILAAGLDSLRISLSPMQSLPMPESVAIGWAALERRPIRIKTDAEYMTEAVREVDELLR